MSGNRSRKETLKYRRYIKKLKKSQTDCQFCDVDNNTKYQVEQTDNFWVIKNIFPYSLWDEMYVSDHLLVIPKEHVDSLKGLPDSTAVEYVRLIEAYESKGYNIYARAPGSATKSVIHQHTHLIKTDKQRHRVLIHIKKPYFRISF